ncbi:DEAD/DEAH box helicase [Achromobacter xylosoxidans]|uniref:DEAD/DEAH box helicase n=1 Tax=Alcaligenes xylosoxydans xylosoxydans TaxID=85698 RepID=UPI001EEB489D|nr:C-terminal helicase domain-containing protein [Achromobacter xylosoxidans]
MSMGTWLPGKENGKVWVGSPLRVHRRCDDPMFSISNDIAYDGLMVQGKSQSAHSWPHCHWIDVRAQTSVGNWVPEEGEAARRLLRSLQAEHQVASKDIFLISPFKDAATQLRAMARMLGLDPAKTGTVHTTQGKEAEVVILVLGDNPQRPGAKDWAAQSPNLLNVAVSRAKARLYVIGDRAAWRQHPYFRVLDQRLGVDSEAPSH